MEQDSQKCKNFLLFFSQLDTKDKVNYEAKVQTFSVVYKMLSGKRAKYHFDNV
jgi:hypothetical protein